MRVVTKDGRAFDGTPKQIVQQMAFLTLGRTPEVVEYIQQAAVNASLLGVTITVPEAYLADENAAAAHFIDQCLSTGLLLRAPGEKLS